MERDLGAGERTDVDWLPELVLLESFSGNWENYLEAVYNCFKQDFIDNRPVFEGIKLALKRHPLSSGKEATFWHLISEGQAEEERIPDMRRCERIRWPKPIIDNSKDTAIKCWKNVRRGETRICLWLEQHDYLAVLAERKGYLLLWTGYLVTRHHQKRKLQKEYEKYLKKLKA
ncbi:MAG: hypothetical protein U9O82_11845 [Thermodesulfobacteriota bacterium]|nr:hypothetical protein [Thermodesulfobacteriota bacterium]